MRAFKTLLILAFVCSVNQVLWSQIEFQSGYFISNSGERTNCLIKNLDWKNNPLSFKYKIGENDIVQTGAIEQVKLFSVSEESKYVRETVLIDQSITVVTNLDNNKEPVFKEQTVFLQVLLEGQASLYAYESGSEIRYFYETIDKPITQLIHKKYVTADNVVKTNAAYKSQLWENLKCGDMPMQKMQYLEYEQDELIAYFKDLNNCLGSEIYDWEQNKRKKTQVKINVEVGTRWAHLRLGSNSPIVDGIEFNSRGYSIGLIPELTLPFNKNKWSVYAGLLGRHLQGKTISQSDLVVFKYHTIEILVGLRHSFYLNDDSRIFINPIYSYGFNAQAIVDFASYNDLELSTNQNIGIGAGYAFKNYSLEIRYEHCRNITINYRSLTSCHKSIGLFFGYTL